MATKDNERLRRALFQGSFDPFTIGHKSIVERALKMFDEVVVAVVHNVNKSGFLTIERRLELIREAFATEPRVRVIASDGLTVDVAKEVGATCLLRGVRNAQDFEYEQTMAAANRDLSDGKLETVLLFTLPEMAHISSSLVRELNSFKKPVEKYLP